MDSLYSSSLLLVILVEVPLTHLGAQFNILLPMDLLIYFKCLDYCELRDWASFKRSFKINVSILFLLVWNNVVIWPHSTKSCLHGAAGVPDLTCGLPLILLDSGSSAVCICIWIMDLPHLKLQPSRQTSS